MGRKSNISDAVVFANVGRQLAETGQFRVQDLSKDTGISIGSLYHRYDGRDGLLASAWLDALRAFQNQFQEILLDGNLAAGERAALLTPRFCRFQLERALILHMGRRAKFIGETTSTSIRSEIDTINRQSRFAINRFAKINKLPEPAAHMALVALPLGAVRFYLPGKVPANVDEYVRKAYWGVVGAP